MKNRYRSYHTDNYIYVKDRSKEFALMYVDYLNNFIKDEDDVKREKVIENRDKVIDEILNED